jgi:hypothetical protein
MVIMTPQQWHTSFVRMVLLSGAGGISDIQLLLLITRNGSTGVKWHNNSSDEKSLFAFTSSEHRQQRYLEHSVLLASSIILFQAS